MRARHFPQAQGRCRLPRRQDLGKIHLPTGPPADHHASPSPSSFTTVFPVREGLCCTSVAGESTSRRLSLLLARARTVHRRLLHSGTFPAVFVLLALHPFQQGFGHALLLPPLAAGLILTFPYFYPRFFCLKFFIKSPGQALCG